LGINRVAVRSTLKAGTIAVTASRSGLKAASVEIEARPVKSTDGLTEWMPEQLTSPAV